MMAASGLPISPSEIENNPPPTNNGSSGQPTAEPMSTTTIVTSMPSGSGPQDETKIGSSAIKPSKATVSRNRDTRLPAARTGSVFERLYKTQTAASAAAKIWTPVRAEARRGGTFSTPPPVNNSNRRTPSSARSDVSLDESLKVFQRLHITGTVANTSKRLTPKQSRRYTLSKEMRSPAKIMPSAATPTRSVTNNPKVGYVYSPRMKPLTSLYFDSKYHPGIGREKVDPIKLGYSFFQMLCEYENGGLTSAQLAREIIIAFFKKDFPSGR